MSCVAHKRQFCHRISLCTYADHVANTLVYRKQHLWVWCAFRKRNRRAHKIYYWSIQVNTQFLSVLSTHRASFGGDGTLRLPISLFDFDTLQFISKSSKENRNCLRDFFPFIYFNSNMLLLLLVVFVVALRFREIVRIHFVTT